MAYPGGSLIGPDRATRRALAFWLPLVVFPLLSLALNHADLRAGFALDDTLLLTAIRRTPRVYSRWRGMWGADFVKAQDLIEQWWWRDPDVLLAFWRPLPSLVIEGSVRLFGENAFPLHLLAIVLHGLVAFTTFRLFARLTGKVFIGLCAGLMYLTCEDHTLTVGWISASTDVYCVLFVNLALLRHLNWRQTGRRPALIASLLCLALALACKETAAVTPVAILLLDLFLTRSEGLAPASALRRSWPALAMLAVYLGVYKGLGLGATHTLLYADPLSQPLVYLRSAVITLPIMIVSAVTVFPPALGTFVPAMLAPHAVIGGIAGVLLLWALWPHRRDPVAQWALALFVLALLPQAATDPSQRLLYFPFVPMSYLLTVLICSIAPLHRRLVAGCNNAPRLPRPTRAWGWYVLLGVFLPGAVSASVSPRLLAAGLRKPEREVLTSLELVRRHLRRHPHGTVIIANTGGHLGTLYVASIYELHLDRAVAVRLLSSCNGKVSLERTGERSLIIRTDRAGWVDNLMAKVTRSEPLLTAGRVYPQPPFEATLLQRTPDRRDVLSVRFDFDTPLDDPELLFLSWNGEAFVRLEVSALPVGKVVPLADTSDLLKSMM